jgi:hypothetical protein
MELHSIDFNKEIKIRRKILKAKRRLDDHRNQLLIEERNRNKSPRIKPQIINPEQQKIEDERKRLLRNSHFRSEFHL